MDALENYILQHLDPEDPLLNTLFRETHLTQINPRMATGHIQGRALVMFCRMLQPKRILELGTFTGYATLCMASVLPPDGELHTIEIDDELEAMIRRFFVQSSDGAKIRLHIGNTLDIIPQLQGPFDLVYMDADKRQYTEDYEAVLPLVRKGGFILADNTLWGDKVLSEPHSGDKQTAGIQRFNDHIAHDHRVEKAIIPMRDGLTLLMKK
ncbi:O-methyltransferase [Microbacter margulisiae]|uniref:Putative O-methyltransferase YrrM n=1 Tax=Microbacter margulisiae TaxID=1350067 RepID=A0A7W5DRH9_9PORP|nr:O-methyltransferase [Microbacter margulisiae]MBB3187410.1 putative O-methyltransferase YrrM [Microbacter margulisiae]